MRGNRYGVSDAGTSDSPDAKSLSPPSVPLSTMHPPWRGGVFRVSPRKHSCARGSSGVRAPPTSKGFAGATRPPCTTTIGQANIGGMSRYAVSNIPPLSGWPTRSTAATLRCRGHTRRRSRCPIRRYRTSGGRRRTPTTPPRAGSRFAVMPGMPPGKAGRFRFRNCPEAIRRASREAGAVARPATCPWSAEGAHGYGIIAKDPRRASQSRRAPSRKRPPIARV